MTVLGDKIERAARKGVAFSAAGVLAAIGVAFLTTAGWMVLSELRSPLFAATIIGAIYIGAAAIALAVGMKKPTPRVYTTSQTLSDSGLTPLQTVVLSFLQGFEKGRENARPKQ